jgi:hypothetical protein
MAAGSFARVALTACAIFMSTSTARAQTGASSELRVVVSHGVNGSFASPPCATAPPRATLAERAATIRAAVDQGHVAVDTGSFFGVSSVSQLALTHDVEGLAAVIRDAGLHGIALSRRDLAGPREGLIGIGHAMSRRGVRLIASNLACEPSARALCAALVDQSDLTPIVTVGGLRVAIVTAVHPSALTHIAHDRSAGLTLGDPATWFARAARAARAAGAERVIGVYDPRRERALEDALEVARSIDPEASPDVLLVNGIAGAVQRAVAGENDRMLVIAAPSDGVTRLRVMGDVVRVGAERGATAVPSATAFETDLAETICRETAGVLRGGRLAGPMEASSLVGILGDVLRHAARADVSIVNRGVVDAPHFRTLHGRLRRIDVLLALPFDNAIRTTRVRGSVLRAAFDAAARERLVFRGLTLEGDAIRVNGRALSNEDEYVVAATDFVVDLGILGPAEWTPFTRGSAREDLLRYLDLPRAHDPRIDADDPGRHPRWSFRLGVNGSLTAVQLSNPSTSLLTDAQLTRTQAISANLALDARANADHPNYTWENTLVAKYGLVRALEEAPSMMGMMPEDPVRETADIASLRSVFAWRGLRSRVPRWYVPAPYAELYVESEFTVPTARPFRHLEVRPTGGARFQVNDRFSVFAGYGATAEVLATHETLPAGQSPAVSTLQVGWVLQPGPLATVGGREIQWDSTLDVGMRDVFKLPGLQLRGHLGLAVPLIGPLSLTVGYDLFVRYLSLAGGANSGPSALGFANDLEVGLGLNWARAVQTFAR